MGGVERVEQLVRALNPERNMLPEAVIGVVKSTNDPEQLGRVRCEFKFDWQGNVHQAWCLPVFPMNGLLAGDPPAPGTPLLILFLDGNVGDPVYLGLTRGKPHQQLLARLSYEERDSLHFVIHEALLENLQSLMQWMAKHTHNVTIVPNGVAGPYPLAGVPSSGVSTPPREALPKLKKMRTRGLRLHPSVREAGTE